MTTWKEIPGFPKYLINEHGHVWRKAHDHIDSLGRRYKTEEKITKPEEMGYSNSGYLWIQIGRGVKNRKTFYIHRLIAQLFIENPYEKEIVNHKDGNKRNNSIDNLEWTTYSENSFHALNVLMNKEDRKRYGKHAKGKKLTEEHKEKIRQSNIRTKSKNKKSENKCIICNKECRNRKTCSKECLTKHRKNITSGINNPMTGKTPWNKRR